MCDTAVAMTDDGVLFAKNSDRDPNEAQVLQWHPAATHVDGAPLAVTHREIPQVRRTHATVLSRPWWLWGAEMGANEHGVVIGNEAVFTRRAPGRARRGDRPGLIGMDLLRLALERSSTRAEAVETIVSLLEAFGQNGPCSHDHPGFSYDNSFLIADRDGAIVLETAGRAHATQDVTGRGRSISNGLTIPGFAERFTDPLRTAVARAAGRRAITSSACQRVDGPADLMRMLRSNGGPTPSSPPRWSRATGAMAGPNLHAGGSLAASQTVSSWVADLREPRPIHWVTATAEPAFSLFKPVRHDAPADLGPVPSNIADPSTLWWRHEAIHRTALRDWSTAHDLVATERDRVEARWLTERPSTAEALTEAAQIEAGWHRALVAVLGGRDTRPRWLRARWRGYDAAARAAVAWSDEALLTG